ncbi:MAG: flagellar basal body P-ring formation protein FlgA [Rhodobacteraceae bacterium]|nr:flagellar basal body P-ring formation protein FlgA [Paracoccaceae bacterium]
MKKIILIMLFGACSSALADVIVPARTIRAREVINPEDLVRKPGDISGAISDPKLVIGQEARVVLYVGRPIRPGDLRSPAIVARNDLVTLVFSRGPLRISTEGRALGRGSVGESIRAMNLISRVTVSGTIQANGSIEVH